MSTTLKDLIWNYELTEMKYVAIEIERFQFCLIHLFSAPETHTDYKPIHN